MNKLPTGKGLCVGLAIIALSSLPVASALANTLTKHPASQIPDATKSRIQGTFFKSPLTFEANQGQTDSQVKFLARGNGYALFLTPTEAVMVLRKPDDKVSVISGQRIRGKRAEKPELRPQHSLIQNAVRMKLAGANDDPDVAGLEELPGKVNYFKGNDPAKWRTNVSTYAKVEYRDVCPGINLVYYANQRQLEYDFVVSPGSDPSIIQLAFEGADKIEVDSQGDLVVKTASGDLRMHKPLTYQIVNGVKKNISVAYLITPNAEVKSPSLTSVRFQVAAYDYTKPLVIDPALDYSTYFGGNDYDYGTGIALDSAGNAYVTGYTASTNFPVQNALQPELRGISDAFVANLNAAGALDYSTYLGGNDNDEGFAISIVAKVLAIL